MSEFFDYLKSTVMSSFLEVKGLNMQELWQFLFPFRFFMLIFLGVFKGVTMIESVA